EKYRLSFSDAEKAAFVKTVEVPVPIRGLNQYLNLNEGQRQATIPGIPLDSTDLQLVDWIELSLEHDPGIKLAIKGDVKTQYPKFKELIKQLQERNINKFQLITNSEVKPK